MKKLSAISGKISGQPMFKVLEKIQKLEREGRRILHFELGEPDFATPANIVDAGCKGLHDGMTHYTSSRGLFEFRQAVRRATAFSRHFTPDDEQILVTPGANSIIYYTIKCLADPGDDVLVPNPGFSSYFSAIAACGANPVSIRMRPEKNMIMQAEDVEKAITPKSKLLIINSPANPTGAVIPPEEMQKIYAVAEKYDLYLLSDEIYARLIFTGDRFFSPAMLDHCRERTIIANGFSKAFAMTGWRLGVAVGPHAVIEKMALLNETIVSCVPPFIQHAGIEAIQGDQTEIKMMCEEYKKRCFFLADELNKLPGISCRRPGGAIYVFPDIRGTGMDSEEFCDFALNEASVALLPGTNFGEFGDGFIRLSCVSSLTAIREAVAALDSALRKRK
ncbi:MAG: pyridoxal phosphate-dependent aminotransferase [Lentisphaerae bacterium]|nr:pyridoxal phosphate-dependent aminotransferase [Lentisphaerota bacterium]